MTSWGPESLGAVEGRESMAGPIPVVVSVRVIAGGFEDDGPASAGAVEVVDAISAAGIAGCVVDDESGTVFSFLSEAMVVVSGDVDVMAGPEVLDEPGPVCCELAPRTPTAGFPVVASRLLISTSVCGLGGEELVV